MFQFLRRWHINFSGISKGISWQHVARVLLFWVSPGEQENMQEMLALKDSERD